MTFIALISVVILAYVNSKITHYSCPKCRSTFKISFIKDLTSPNNLKGKFLKCPKCSYKGFMKETPK